MRHRYLNRELSWLEFNRRVLAEAANEANPPLERVKFLAIFESNLDEFYMVRVSGLIEQFESGVLQSSPDGRSPSQQLEAISEVAGPLRREAARVWHEELVPKLAEHGIRIRKFADLSPRKRREMRRHFEREVFPILTPLVMNPGSSFPFISNRSLNLVVELADQNGEVRLARVKVPNGVPRLVRVAMRRAEFVLLEDFVSHHLETLFPGVEVRGVHAFRVVRDADVEIRELEAADLIASIEETLRLRRFGDPVLLQHGPNFPEDIRKFLMESLRLDETDVIEIDGLLGMEALWELAKIDRPQLRFAPHHPYVPDRLSTPARLFQEISDEDQLLHHPYDGFRSVETFVESAATDPAVVGIKQTLYRVGSESPIVESLLSAAEAGKQVAAMVELKARFDESNNLVWARALERAGVHVTYGFPELKTHCKLSLVVRREASRTRTYAHIGTGNYNPSTARLYTDLGLFTRDEAITQDVAELFNYLTGFSKQTRYRKLLVAPLNLREGILDRIRREATFGPEGRILIKVNSLVDPEVIDALYDASSAGVPVDLLVRGVSCLRPGVPGLSERIRVISVVGRFLEHSRVYYFGNGGTPDVLIGSADCMRRNLDRRIEVLVPVEDPDLIRHLHDHILTPYFRDNVRSWEQTADGKYVRRPMDGPRFDVQEWFIRHPSTKA